MSIPRDKEGFERMNEFNIVLAGVGGQGTLLSAEILGTAAVNDGLNVRVSEIHGMAQRGGAVTSMVRIGKNVRSPTVLEGCADVLLGFEPLETLRNLLYASEKSLVLMSNEIILPLELSSKNVDYPTLDEIMKKIQRFTMKVVCVDVLSLTKKVGSILTRNVVLLGALAGSSDLPLKTDSILYALKELVPEKHVELNVRAFKLGYESVCRPKK